MTGAYAFGVGVANIGKVAPFGKFVSTSRWLTGAQSVGRWLLWAGLVVLLGCACTCWFVWRGTLPARGSSLLWAGWVLAAVGVVDVHRNGAHHRARPLLLPLFGTPEGLVMVAQLTAVLVLCGLAVAATAALPCRPTLAVLGGAAAFAMMTVIWETHANGPSPYRFFNLTVQWLHVMGVGVWVGGLAWLLLGLRGLPGPERATAGRRFSVIATIGLAVVALTGLSRAAAEVGAPANLLHTSFGRLLLVKLALFVGLVVLGARNRFVEVPALAKDDALPPFRRTLRGEVVLGVAILAVTGVLGGVATGREAATAARASAASRVVLSGSDYATTVRVRLVVDPGTVGSNRFTATVSDYATGRPLCGRARRAARLLAAWADDRAGLDPRPRHRVARRLARLRTRALRGRPVEHRRPCPDDRPRRSRCRSTIDVRAARTVSERPGKSPTDRRRHAWRGARRDERSGGRLPASLGEAQLEGLHAAAVRAVDPARLAVVNSIEQSMLAQRRVCSGRAQ